MIERYIEKIVLAVCALLLIFAVIRWGVSSPLEMEVLTNGRGTMESAPPKQADAKLLEAARDINRIVQNEKPDDQQSNDDYVPLLGQLQDEPFKHMELLSLAPPGRLPIDYDTGPEPERPKLKEIVAAMPKPTKPLVRVEWELHHKPREQGDTPDDVVTAHIAATYPWKNIQNQWNDKLATAAAVLPEVIAVAVEAEIRERRFDGTWSEPRLVQAVRKPVTDGAGTETIPPDLPDYDRTNAEEIQQAKRELISQWQEEILQPSFWDVLWTIDEWGTWRKHLPVTSVSDAIPEDEEKPTRAARAFPGRLPPTADPRLSKMADPRLSKRGDPRLSKRGDPRLSKRGGPMDKRPPGASRPPSRTVRPVSGLPGKEIARPKETPVPSLADQIQAGEVLFWLHDTVIEGSKVYQYRVRLVLVNPLVTYVGDVDDPEDAKPAKLRTPFSDWSSPVSVPQATEFFVTSQNASQQYAFVTVFRRYWGQCVRKKYKVFEGNVIGDTANMKLINPEDGSQDSRAVGFDTGAVVVRLDFNKTVKKKNITKPTVEMYYLDQAGQLRTRIGATDRDSERYDQLKKEAERTKRAADRAKSAAVRD